MIKLENLTFSLNGQSGTKTILNNLNFEFPKNKITVITGQNGSGKSTLVKLIMGILQPTSGAIYFDNQNITSLDITQRANLGISLAFQQPVRFKGITVQNLLNIASKSPLTQNQACEILAKVGLCAKNYLQREVDDSLSGGELKRIELATTIAKGGDVLLFDEPEAGIDLWSFDYLVKIFQNFKNKTIIVVSHQKRLIEIADYILLLDTKNDAVLGQRGEMLELLKKPYCKGLGGIIDGKN